jgi:hypothetical protein
MRRIVPVLLAVSTLIASTACGSSGRALREPGPGITSPAPTSTTSTTAAPPTTFTISSPTISYGGEVPATYTCAGKDVSPPLQFYAIPAGAASLALAVTTSDDAKTTVNWLVTGIPSTVDHFVEGATPPGTELPNDSGAPNWSGPCPKAGHTVSIEFTLYALTQPFTPPTSAAPAQVKAALDNAPGARAVMTANFTGS